MRKCTNICSVAGLSPDPPVPMGAYGGLFLRERREGGVYTYKGKEGRGPTSEADESDEREDVEGGGLNPCKVMASTINTE